MEDAFYNRENLNPQMKGADAGQTANTVSVPEGVDAVIKKCDGVTGIRDIEQAAEHIVAHALYQIEVNHVQSVTFDGGMIEELLS